MISCHCANSALLPSASLYDNKKPYEKEDYDIIILRIFSGEDVESCETKAN
jgi:hypothetical protein